jgi:hypothetical protein
MLRSFVGYLLLRDSGPYQIFINVCVVIIVTITMLLWDVGPCGIIIMITLHFIVILDG